MVRGRKPKPTAVKEASGALRKNPQRRNRREPKPPAGAPPMPSIVAADPAAKTEWMELCGWLADMGTLAKADRSLMAIYCTTFSEWVKYMEHVREHGVCVATANGGVTTAPEAHQYNKLSDRMLKLLTELGLTPSARSRIRTPEQNDEEDPFQNLLERFSGSN